MCGMGYTVVEKTNSEDKVVTYECEVNDCINDKVIEAIPDCANLYNGSFIKEGAFEYTEYKDLLVKC